MKWILGTATLLSAFAGSSSPLNAQTGGGGLSGRWVGTRSEHNPIGVVAADENDRCRSDRAGQHGRTWERMTGGRIAKCCKLTVSSSELICR